MSGLPVLHAEAPAKINRELRVGAVRGDGFHEVRSRIVAIDLADRLEVAHLRGGFDFRASGIPVREDESNLVVRAARALAQRLGRPLEARIALEKRIPVGAGLGGGSSDAARALALLAKLWDAAIADDELARIAATLGSDVPFFLVGGEADVSGRGDRVEPLPDSPPRDLLVAVPPFPISTSQVYAAHRRRTEATGPGRLPETLEVALSGGFFGPNDLAFAVLEVKPDMGVLLESSRSLASESAITGSGSAIVLEGATPDAADALAARHSQLAIRRCRTLTRAEYRARTESSGGSRWRLLK